MSLREKSCLIFYSCQAIKCKIRIEVSDLHGVKNVPPIRREWDDVLQQNRLINQQRKRHEIQEMRDRIQENSKGIRG